MSVDCPTAAAACFSGIERGRSGRARRAIPVAIAPEVTSTTSRPPSARAPAMSAASAAIRRRSGPVDPRGDLAGADLHHEPADPA